MENFNRKAHWEKIYQTKPFENVSWYQEKPVVSLAYVEQLGLSKEAKIIDIGGGDSYFVDYLLKLGFKDITVLDISAAAIDRAKQRLGTQAAQVNWIIADASNFESMRKYDFWHDRAAFHFLTAEKEVDNYIETLNNSLEEGGYVVMGTFSEKGPLKCSGIPIQQYSEAGMTGKFAPYFKKLSCQNVNHRTPFDTIQNFTFCSFQK
jgi:2-polyprenyl-3-methyl-5-hydroxy-6-metoxy-1,4-benzoquinol methylase